MERLNFSYIAELARGANQLLVVLKALEPRGLRRIKLKRLLDMLLTWSGCLEKQVGRTFMLKSSRYRDRWNKGLLWGWVEANQQINQWRGHRWRWRYLKPSLNFSIFGQFVCYLYTIFHLLLGLYARYVWSYVGSYKTIVFWWSMLATLVMILRDLHVLGIFGPLVEHTTFNYLCNICTCVVSWYVVIFGQLCCFAWLLM